MFQYAGDYLPLLPVMGYHLTNSEREIESFIMSEVPGQNRTQSHHLPLVVAVDVGGTQLRAAVARGTQLLSRVGVLTGENPTPQRVLPRLFDIVQQAIKGANVQLEQLAGIGIAAPGPLDSRTGIVYDPPNLPEWSGVPLRDLFYEKYHLPIYVENDANAAALGEYMFGAGRGVSNLVYLTISTGIGGGIILDDKIFAGVSGTAGELGHISIDWHGERCNCGNIGCLEYLASGTAIARKANQAIAIGRGQQLLDFVLAHPDLGKAPESQAANTPVDSVTNTPISVNARTVALAAEAGVPLAQAIIREAAEALGCGLVSIIHIFNPTMIILGGGVMQMGPLIMEPVRHIVAERTMHVPRDAVQIVLAQLGPDVGLVGAGALIYYHTASSVHVNTHKIG